MKGKTLAFVVFIILLTEAMFVTAKNHHSKKKAHHKKALYQRKRRSHHNRSKGYVKAKKRHSKSKIKHKSRAERLAMLSHIINNHSEKPRRQLSGSGGGLSIGPIKVKFMPPPTPNKAPISITIPELDHVFTVPDPNREKTIALGKHMLFSPRDHRTQIYRNKKHSSNRPSTFGFQNPDYGMIAPGQPYSMYPEMSNAYQNFVANPGLSSGAASLAEGMSPYDTPMWRKRRLM